MYRFLTDPLMYHHVGGGGKGIRPNQQQQQQQQQQTHFTHHLHHHNIVHQNNHYQHQHQQTQQQSHSTPPPTPPLLHANAAAAVAHQLGQQQQQQQPSAVGTAAHHLHQAAHLQQHTQPPLTQLFYPYTFTQVAAAAAPPPSSIGSQRANNVLQTAGQMATTASQQKTHAGSGTGGGRHHHQQQQSQQLHNTNAGNSNNASGQTYANAPNANGSTTFMTQPFLPTYHQQTVMAAVYGSNAAAAAAANVPQNSAHLYQPPPTVVSQAQHQQVTTAQYSYYQATLSAPPTPQQQMREVLTNPHGMPPYVLPGTMFTTIQPGPRTALLARGAHNNAGTTGNSTLSVAPLISSANMRQPPPSTAFLTSSATTYLTNNFGAASLDIGAAPLPPTQPMMLPTTPYAPIPPNATPRMPGPAYGNWQSTKKKREHAIPIIDPKTKQNILDPKPLSDKNDSNQSAGDDAPIEKNKSCSSSTTTTATTTTQLQTADHNNESNNSAEPMQPKEFDKAITVSIAEAPFNSTMSTVNTKIIDAAAVHEKIDQQMQTDAVQPGKNVHSKCWKPTSYATACAGESVDIDCNEQQAPSRDNDINANNAGNSTNELPENIEETHIKSSQDKKIQVLMPKSSLQSDEKLQLNQPYAAVVANRSSTSPAKTAQSSDYYVDNKIRKIFAQQQQSNYKKNNTSNVLNAESKIKYAFPTATTTITPDSSVTSMPTITTACLTFSANTTKTSSIITPAAINDHEARLSNATSALSKIIIKSTQTKVPASTFVTTKTTTTTGAANDQANNNFTNVLNRGHQKEPFVNVVTLPQKSQKNWNVASVGVVGVAVSGHGINNVTNINPGNMEATNQGSQGANNKKTRKNKRNKDSQKKLKQMEAHNRSRSQSSSSASNNNNNSNNSTLMSGKKIIILTNSNSATLLKNNNNYSNNNNILSTDTLQTTTTAVSAATTTNTSKTPTTSTLKILKSNTIAPETQTTDCKLSSCSRNLTTDSCSLKNSLPTTIANVIDTNANNVDTETPLSIDTTDNVKFAKIHSSDSNSSSDIISPAIDCKQTELSTNAALSDTDSETLTADSPEVYMRAHDIVQQYLQPTLFVKQLEEEQQLTFLNSSSSACEDEEESSNLHQLEKNSAKFSAADEALAAELLFGDFPEEINSQPLAEECVISKTSFSSSNIDVEDSSSCSNYELKTIVATEITRTTPTIDFIEQANEQREQRNETAKVMPKVFRYSLNQLKELENMVESRKPPMVDCKNRECISQLFVSRQHHHVSHSLPKHMSSQYQQMNYGDNFEFVGKRRGSSGIKKHHDHHTSSVISSGLRDIGLPQRKADIIRVQLLLKEEIKLSECENAWQPDTLRSVSSSRSPSAASQEDLDTVLKKVRGVLNKLTPDNFDVLLKTMSSIILNTQEKMQQVMLLIFEKTVSEPNFAPTYAKFCKVLFQEIRSESRFIFNTSLIKRIQYEFETNVNDADAKRVKLQPLMDRLENCEDAKERIDLQAELEEREFQFRRRAWGTVRFIGEMYKLQSLTTDRVLLCLESLLQHGCEEKFEYMCKLLTTVGPLLEASAPENISRLDKIFRRTQEIINKSRNNKTQIKISSRVRFMMQDVIDLRERGWDQSTANNRNKSSTQSAAYGEEKLSQSAGVFDQQRTHYGHQQNQQQQQQHQQRGRYQTHKAGAHQSNVSQGNSSQQQQEGQKPHIDLHKLKFSSAEDQTMLGNKLAYVWRIASGRHNHATTITTSVHHGSAHAHTSGNFKQHNSCQDTRGEKSTVHSRSFTSHVAVGALNASGSTLYGEYNNKSQEPFIAKDFLNNLVEELIENGGNWKEEVLQQWCSITRDQQLEMLRYLLLDYLHLSAVKRVQRQACARIFMHLMSCSNNFDREVFSEAYAQFGEQFPDLLLDVPKGWTYVFDFVGPILQIGLLDFNDIWLPSWACDEYFTERFVKAMFDYYLCEFGQNYTHNLWHKVFGGQEALAQNLMEELARWFDFGLQELNERCNLPNATGLTKQQKQQQEHGINNAQHLERIAYLLNATDDCDMAVDYIATNVHITKSFLSDLIRFICCEYAITVNDTNKMSSGVSEICLNVEIFKGKCLNLLRACIDKTETIESCLLNNIVKSLQTCYDEPTFNTLLCQIFYALYESDMIPKDGFHRWYRSLQFNDAENSIVDDESGSVSSNCESIAETLDITLTSVNVADEVTQVQTHSHVKRRRNKQRVYSNKRQNQQMHQNSRSASNSTPNSPTSTQKMKPATSSNSGSTQLSKQIHAFMERLI